jgi:hypothetical protein
MYGKKQINVSRETSVRKKVKKKLQKGKDL